MTTQPSQHTQEIGRLSGPARLPRHDPTPRISSTGLLHAFVGRRILRGAKQHARKGERCSGGVCARHGCLPNHTEPPPLRPSPDTTVHLRTKRSVDSSRYLPRHTWSGREPLGTNSGRGCGPQSWITRVCAVPSRPQQRAEMQPWRFAHARHHGRLRVSTLDWPPAHLSIHELHPPSPTRRDLGYGLDTSMREDIWVRVRI